MGLSAPVDGWRRAVAARIKPAQPVSSRDAPGECEPIAGAGRRVEAGAGFG